MRIWIDLTNPARPRPAAGRRDPPRGRSRRRGDGARLRADPPALRALRDRAHGDRAPPRRPGRGQGARTGLVSFADLVISAGGTMNREAVALGTPVYTTYGGRLGGVDEALIRDGRLRPLTDPRALELVKRQPGLDRVRRDPAL